MKFIIDTHIFFWWCLDKPELTPRHVQLLEDAEKRQEAYGLSIISFWEIAKLVECGKLNIDFSLDQWFSEISGHPLVDILPLNPPIILDSTRLGKNFPKDPADQLITATARHYGVPLLTIDEKIIKARVVGVI